VCVKSRTAAGILPGNAQHRFACLDDELSIILGLEENVAPEQALCQARSLESSWLIAWLNAGLLFFAGFYISIGINRWWTMRTAGHDGLCNAISNIFMIVGRPVAFGTGSCG
jgi:hypothetical protein